jgi:pimeloyl-ACP methyl ester carboxylesterase
MVVNLHGSGGANLTTGRQYRAAVSGAMAYGGYDEFAFSTVRYASSAGIYYLRPVDSYGNYPSSGVRRESMWLGFRYIPDGYVRPITELRLNALLSWASAGLATLTNPVKTCLTGGSMGGWGTLNYGLRYPRKFAALYPDRPRWRYNAAIGSVAVAEWTNTLASYPVASAPSMAPEYGGESVAVRMDHVAWVGNVANFVPWIGWCVGRADGFTEFSDHVAAVAALRSAKRGFAFAWNAGNHTTGSILSEITQSYPFGTFEIGKGYPLFTEHSGDQDPSVDTVGGINIGLSFRNVVEGPSGWSCEVTSILGARTVKVEPISEVFTTPVSAQLVTIPAANSWVPVSFPA